MNLRPDELLPLPAGVRIRRLADGAAVGRYLRTDLSTVFQPLFASDTGGIAGHEAFVRAHGQGARDIAPWHLFSLVASDAALVALDRLCRVVHTLNFLPHKTTGGKLFLNVHGRLLAAVREDHGHTFREAVDKLGIDPRQIVIETPESANLEAKLLALVLSNFRLNGFSVAANVGDAYELDALLCMVRPDYVKLDARRFSSPDAINRALDLIERRGIRAVLMRIESRAQLEFLQERPGLLLQGRALADAAAEPLDGLGIAQARSASLSSAWPSVA